MDAFCTSTEQIRALLTAFDGNLDTLQVWSNICGQVVVDGGGSWMCWFLMVVATGDEGVGFLW